MRVFILALLLAVAACGSDYDGDRPIGQAYPGAYYIGTMITSDTAVDFGIGTAVAIATQDGYIVISSGNTTFSGRLILQGQFFDVALDATRLPGFTYSDGSTKKKMRIAGTIEQDGGTKAAGALNAQFILDPQQDFVYAEDVDGRFELTGFTVDTVRNAGVNIIAGTYTDGASTITFSSDGTFTGQDASGCTLNGSYSIPDPHFNAYRIHDVDITCGGTTLSGVGNAALITSSGAVELLLLGRTGDVGFDYQLPRQ